MRDHSLRACADARVDTMWCGTYDSSLVDAIAKAAYRSGTDIALAMDPAASELYRDGRYTLPKSGLPALTTSEMVDLFAQLATASSGKTLHA